jgi:putative ABC transport system permease protein
MFSVFEATTPLFMSTQDWNVDIGRFISESDLDNWNRICVIGMKIWQDLFGETNPIGEEIKLNFQRYRIVGVMEEKGKMFGGEWDRDEQVMIPLTTAQKRMIGNDRVNIIWCRAGTYEKVDRAVEEARLVLMQRHNGEEFFQIESAKQFLESVGKVTTVIKAMLGGIAAIALLVGGVGIMNIMLVSVTERTREIGLRKAMGAKRRDVLFQFIIEALVMCLVGGAIGILVGILMGAGMAQIIKSFVFQGLDWPSTVSLTSVVMGISFSVLIGLFFGIYPAYKASKLQPVEALRYE